MRIFITGGLGFIGGHLIKAIKEMLPDAEYVIYDLKDGNDILDYEDLLEAMTGASAVVHLAALINVIESKEQPTEYFQTNVMGTLNVIKAAKELKIEKIVYASSAACYESSSSPYALTKYFGELMPQALNFQGDYISLRFFNIYGPGQDVERKALIPSVVNKLSKNEPITVYGEGTQTRDYIHVNDVARSIICALTLKHSLGTRVFDIGTGKEFSVISIINLIASSMLKEPKIVYENSTSKGVGRSKASVWEAQTYLRFMSSIDVMTGIKKLIKENHYV